MDLQGKAFAFPRPAEVVVNATQLTPREKALILYRHARAVQLAEPARRLLKEHARAVVEVREFTPERIRRFVSHRLSTLMCESKSV